MSAWWLHLRVPVPVTGRSRYPDVTIDCGRYERGAHDATSPAVVFEVLSQSTKWFDQNKKLTDYDTIPTIQQYVCIAQDELRISVWTRGVEENFLQQDDITEISATLNLSCIGVSPQPVPTLMRIRGLLTGHNSVPRLVDKRGKWTAS